MGQKREKLFVYKLVGQKYPKAFSHQVGTPTRLALYAIEPTDAKYSLVIGNPFHEYIAKDVNPSLWKSLVINSKF